MIEKILLVDDDEVSNFVTERTLLSSWDHLEVSTVTNGQLAKDFLINNDDPDVILLDLNMPLMNGLEFLEVFESEISSSAKVVILSTSNRREDKEAALKFESVVGYIEKPVSVSVLETMVQ